MFRATIPIVAGILLTAVAVCFGDDQSDALAAKAIASSNASYANTACDNAFNKMLTADTSGTHAMNDWSIYMSPPEAFDYIGYGDTDFDSGEALYAEALNLYGDGDARFGGAQSLYDDGQYDSARDLWNGAGPNTASAKYTLAASKWNAAKDKYDSADEWYALAMWLMNNQ